MEYVYENQVMCQDLLEKELLARVHAMYLLFIILGMVFVVHVFLNLTYTRTKRRYYEAMEANVYDIAISLNKIASKHYGPGSLPDGLSKVE